ncbi:uncharacterized protein LOC103971427 [Musa acuminata AAA Group]|uniref:Uncharacterized protein n=1 Tax=Musa acuminata subsp. malaccensis TaxID=214687 RepID=A0A804L764_MUSAM|nr:PREDICTED: uncharacterized protein LOC103971427 [Musa acuminata subsp. malaccensis]
MGSLMAGWSSPVLDPETVRHRRNRSLTKEEIEIYRSSHGRVEGEKGPYESRSAPNSPKRHQETDELDLRRSLLWHQLQNTEPAAEPLPDNPTNTGDWWTRSNSAFLNEPPREEADVAAHKYTAQFHVAELATKKARA